MFLGSSKLLNIILRFTRALRIMNFYVQVAKILIKCVIVSDIPLCLPMNFASYVLNKINEVVVDPFAVKDLSSYKFSDSEVLDDTDLLSLHENAGYYDAFLSNPNVKNSRIRLFHISTSKKREALELYKRFCDKLLVLCRSSNACYVSTTLQNLCTLIRTRSLWSPAHIAVEAGLKDVYGNGQGVSKWINSQSCELHYTPLHIACQLNDEVILKALVLGGADLSKQDDKGNTVLHLACTISADKVFQFLCESANKKVLNMENSDGDTALHITSKYDRPKMCKQLLACGANPYHCGTVALPIHFAVKHKSTKVLKLLLEHDPKLVNERCKKHGGIPLHWCKEKDQINLLYEFHTPTEVLSNASHLPLHVMVLHGRLEAAVAIILGNAKVNGKGRHGNSALHLAIEHDYVMLVKMLLLFGADHTIKNDFGESPGLLALRSNKKNKETIVSMLSAVGGITIASPKPLFFKRREVVHSEGYKVLCLDGGGVRGLVTTQILMAIEKLCGKQTKDLFDWIAGTSTGGILALALSQGKDAVQVQRLYFRFKDKVFNGSRPYSAEPLEEFLKREFGEHSTMESISSGPKVIVSTALADRKPMQLHWFRNYSESSGSNSSLVELDAKRIASDSLNKLKTTVPSLEQPLWKAARCSGAAPTYFRPMDSFLDGGLIANNPTLDALTEIHNYCKANQKERLKHKKEVSVVLSVGTGCGKISAAG